MPSTSGYMSDGDLDIALGKMVRFQCPQHRAMCRTNTMYMLGNGVLFQCPQHRAMCRTAPVVLKVGVYDVSMPSTSGYVSDLNLLNLQMDQLKVSMPSTSGYVSDRPKLMGNSYAVVSMPSTSGYVSDLPANAGKAFVVTFQCPQHRAMCRTIQSVW